ncbi:YsnF/AvaK domain-containing protein [Parvularcula dongshanensis]|uniref:Stress response protein YsnF n=1 Tax=Parvularcula dongshanensis TaxID=1173995 RepID=A0A840HYJ4_9PROT|nr:YsnF/AvaK domain-containing protein [Parvularcula dongshanensis]MBB4657517.1 stress response protein YsnF [Parvularcula dongshanensis]
MDRTVTAVYGTRQEAEAAKRALKGAGIHVNNVRVIDAESEKAAGRYENGRYERLSGTSLPDDELHTYHDALDRGETLVQARVRDKEVDEAVRILQGSGLDLDAREKSYTDEHRFATRNAYGRGRTDDQGQTIDVVEERLNVGKREVDKGAVNVRSYVVEREVGEDVTLRDEEVEIHSRKVGRTLSPQEADELFHGKTIEVHETGEEAVIEKEAVLKEQVEVDKVAKDKTTHVVDKIRETKVDVDDETAGHHADQRDAETRTDKDLNR